jgi:hypothetical protein
MPAFCIRRAPAFSREVTTDSAASTFEELKRTLRGRVCLVTGATLLQRKMAEGRIMKGAGGD